MEKKNLLVLGGGSIKGAYQAGALSVLLKFYPPHSILGISAGAMNGTFIAKEVTQRVTGGQDFQAIDWADIGQRLLAFWRDNIKRKSSIIDPQFDKFITHIGNFPGFNSNLPLRKIVEEEIKEFDWSKSPIDIQVGAANIISGKIDYFSAKGNNPEEFYEYVIASSAVPFVMPISKLDGFATNEKVHYVDGALRDSAPFGRALKSTGMTRLVGVLCHSEDLLPYTPEEGKIPTMDFAERTMDIVSTEQTNNDLRELEFTNIILDKFPDCEHPEIKGRSKVDFAIVRPNTQLKFKINDFSSSDINDMIAIGINDARKVVESKRAFFEIPSGTIPF